MAASARPWISQHCGITLRIDSKYESCITMVYNGAMALEKTAPARHTRRSVTLSREVARQVDAMAKRRRLSDNRVLVELIEQGLEARKRKERAFFDLVERFRAANDPKQVKALGEELGRFVFGD
jgi:predicted transcriptional regulator